MWPTHGAYICLLRHVGSNGEQVKAGEIVALGLREIEHIKRELGRLGCGVVASNLLLGLCLCHLQKNRNDLLRFFRQVVKRRLAQNVCNTEIGLEEDFGAAEALAADCDDVAIKVVGGLLLVQALGGDSRRGRGRRHG